MSFNIRVYKSTKAHLYIILALLINCGCLMSLPAHALVMAKAYASIGWTYKTYDENMQELDLGGLLEVFRDFDTEFEDFGNGQLIGKFNPGIIGPPNAVDVELIGKAISPPPDNFNGFITNATENSYINTTDDFFYIEITPVGFFLEQTKYKPGKGFAQAFADWWFDIVFFNGEIRDEVFIDRYTSHPYESIIFPVYPQNDELDRDEFRVFLLTHVDVAGSAVPESNLPLPLVAGLFACILFIGARKNLYRHLNAMQS